MTTDIRLGEGPTHPPAPTPPSTPPSPPPAPTRPPTKPPRRGADDLEDARPAPARPPSKPPRKPIQTKPIRGDHAEHLDLIDGGLVGLLDVACSGPAGHRADATPEQACAAEILLFRLRAARTAVAELRAALALPARRTLTPMSGCGPGGPGHQPPVAAGKEPTPGSATASGSAVRESRTGSDTTLEAGAHVPAGKGPGCKGRAVGADGAATTPRLLAGVASYGEPGRWET